MHHHLLKESMLTPTQAEHVASVSPLCRAEMTKYLEDGVNVVIKPQWAEEPDGPPIAIAVASDPSFWIDLCDSIELARERATALGLHVVSD